MIGKINPYANADTIKEAFLWWEQLLEVKAPVYKLFTIGSPVDSMKYEVATKDEAVYAGSVDWAWNATDLVDLGIDSGLANAITNYAIIKVGDEILAVKSVNRTANTIEVFSRGLGETTGAAHADGTVIDVLGFNLPVGVKDIEAGYREQTTDFNTVMKTTVPALEYTKEDVGINRKLYGENGYNDFISSEMLDKDKDLVVTMNKLLIHGTRAEGTATTPAQTRGLIEEATLNGNIVTSFGAISSLSKINDALLASQTKKGEANVLVCGVSAYNDIQKLDKVENQLPAVLNRLESELGTRVVTIHTVVGSLVIVLDQDMPADKMVICNSKDLSIHPLVGFTTPGGDKTIAQESTRNDQAFVYDTLSQVGTYYKNSSRNMTIITGITYS